MDNVPIKGLCELEAHLQQLNDDPSLPFQVDLLEDVELQLTEDNIPPLLPRLLPLLAGCLKVTAQDPTPLLSLTTKVLSPLSFTQRLEIADPPSLLTALSSPLPGVNLLAFTIIRKAADFPSDVSILRAIPNLVGEMVRCWLATESVDVGEFAARVLRELLETDCDIPQYYAVDEQDSQTCVDSNETNAERRVPGHGQLWQLIFSSRPILSLIQRYCSVEAETTDGTLPRAMHQVTISQGRLLRLLPRLCAMNYPVLSRCVYPDLFVLPSAEIGQLGQGLLQWAALGMVDRRDFLMNLNLIDFFETLVSIMRRCKRSSELDSLIGNMVKTAIRFDDSEHKVEVSLKTLPSRTVEEEAEPLRAYITDLLRVE
ncbi:hypothetical protein E4U33_002462 [Claviceps sp. LM78 group G4]|nr:hypothetical protein E4U33_002462 [Claviceps sp. LM78 group G4]